MNTKTDTTARPVLVRILVDRYEDTGEGYDTAPQALASATEYLGKLLSGSESRGRKNRSGVKLDRADILASSVDDNGPECDGADCGRWTLSFEIVARLLVKADTDEEAERVALESLDLDELTDPALESLGEWASNFSADILRDCTK